MPDMPNYGGFLPDLLDSRSGDYGFNPDAYGQNNVDQLGLDVGTFLNESGASAQQASAPPAVSEVKTKQDKQGNIQHTYTISDQAHQYIGQMMEIAQNAIAEKTALSQMLGAKRDVLEKNPLLAEIGRILALGATAYQAPNSRGEALVHAAGAYGGSYFSDTPESLQAQIAQNEAQKMAIAAPIYGELATSARIEQARNLEADREAARNRRADLNEKKSDRATFGTLLGSAMQSARQGDFNPGDFEQLAVSTLGDTPEVRQQAQAAEKQLKTTADAAARNREEKDKNAFNREQATLDAQYKKSIELENLRWQHEKQLKELGLQQTGGPWLGRLNAVEDDIRKVTDIGNQSTNFIEAERQKLAEAGVPGFDNINEPTDKVAAKVVTTLNSKYVTLPPEKEGGKPRRVAIGELLGFTDDKEQAAELGKAIKAQSGYQSYKSEIPSLYNQHDEARKGYKAVTKTDYPSIRPTTPTSPVVQSQFYSMDELSKMSIDDIGKALKANRVPKELEARVAELVQKKREAAKGTPSTVSFKDVASTIPEIFSTETLRGMASTPADWAKRLLAPLR